MGISNKFKAPFLIAFCTISLSLYSQSNKFKVTLDAGHGGKDFGAVYSGHIEKNVALGVTLKVGKILEGTSGFEVLYTRKTDVFIDLVERANIANRADANIFISMHCNANKNTAASGTETYVMGMTKNASALAVAKSENAVITLEKDYKQKYENYDPKAPETMVGITLGIENYLNESIALAGKVQDHFTDDLNKKSRGVKQAPYMVLHKAYMPRILIEMGFISNPEDAADLDSEDGQNKIARAIADAIISYKKEYYGNGENEDNIEKPSQKIVTPVIKPTPDDDTILPEKPIVKVPPANKVPQTNVPDNNPAAVNGVTFKIQLAVSSTKVELVPSNFHGLGSLSMLTANNLYKYMYGETTDYDTAKALLMEAKSKGYDSAFVIAFKDGKKITIQEALKH
ncbi:MAG TPA: N-acetylmuramoyl-L-alanine amidase [Flavobacterium sp.]|nr:N-acetylmuramoyl-L-alanine amidase [Flavobacterium sp.]